MKYRLTSIEVKIIGLLALAGCTILAVLSVIYRERVPLFGIIFIWFIVAILLFFLCVLFRHAIVLNSKKRKLIVGRIFIRSIDIDEILTVVVVNKSNRLSMIEVKLKDGKCYRTGGYISVFRSNDSRITEMIVAQLNEEIEKLRSKMMPTLELKYYLTKAEFLSKSYNEQISELKYLI